MSDAARITQAAFLGAKERAVEAKDRRGVRLIRDTEDPTLATGFAYIQPLENLRYGLPVGGSPIRIENIDTDGVSGIDSPRLVRGYGVDWDQLVQGGQLSVPHRIKIPASTTGKWYSFSNVQLAAAGPPRQVTLQLDLGCQESTNSPPIVVALSQSDTRASCEIEVGYELLPAHHPMPLPSGVVIDLDWSSANVAAQWPAAPAPADIDLLFSPGGSIAGVTGGLGPLHFLLNDIQDAVRNLNPLDASNVGEKLVLTVFPQSGSVQTFPIDPTDLVNNSTGTIGADGLADDLFRFAKEGKRAGT